MPICVICKNEFRTRSFFFSVSSCSPFCSQCYKSLPIVHSKIKLDDVEVYSLYAYRHPINSILMDLKVKNDISMSEVFLSPFLNYLKYKYQRYIVLCVPSTEKSNMKRGFNHVKEIFKSLELPMQDVFYKSKNYKQTEQLFSNKENIKKVIKCKVKLESNKRYLIVDDVITSGNTLKTCIDLLKKQGIRKIKCLTICFNYKK